MPYLDMEQRTVCCVEILNLEQFNSLLSEIAHSFVSAKSDGLWETIREAQRAICAFLGLDISTVFIPAQGGNVKLATEYISPGVDAPPIDATVEYHFPWSKKQLFQGKAIVINNVRELPPEAQEDMQLFKVYGFKSILALPLVGKDEQVLGALAFSMVRRELEWTCEHIDKLTFAANIFSIVISRLQAEAELKNKDLYFSGITENSPASILIIKDDRIVYANHSALALFGYTQTELTGQRPELLLMESERARMRMLSMETMAQDSSLRAVCMGRRKDGSGVPIEILGSFFHVGGQVIQFGNIIDISERMRFEKDISESEQRYHSLVESTDSLVWVVDPEKFALTVFNAAFADFFSKTLGISIRLGMTPEDMLPPGRISFLRGAYLQAMKEGVLKFQFTSRFDRTYDIRLSTLTRDGQIFGISAIAKDITDIVNHVREMTRQNEKLDSMLRRSINAISRIGEMRDAYTAGHQRRVQELACAIAREMGLGDETVGHLSIAARIHDIGKIYVPSDILNKPGRLTELEYGLLKTHPIYSYEVAREIDLPEAIPAMILQHHERMDGTGYPNGLTGDKIMLEGRILAVADVVDAMSSHRPYRPSLGLDAALLEIQTYSGVRYDSAVAAACLSLFREKGFAFTQRSPE